MAVPWTLGEARRESLALINRVKQYAIFLLDADGRVMSWNDGARMTKQYADHEIIGQSFSRFFTPEDLAAGKPARLLVRLAQMLAILITNALKYGAGTPIDVEIACDRDVARVSVIDHGIGIAAGDLQRIFAPFERAAPLQHYAGLGLGLYIARGVAEAHGGTITVASEPGHGARFDVELPRGPR